MSDRTRSGVDEGPVTAYVVVHPDEFALACSKVITDPKGYITLLKRKIKSQLFREMAVIILGLQQNDTELPDFLREFSDRVDFVPCFSGDNVNAQSERLRAILVKFRYLRQVIFTGGWKNACLKHTLNNTAVFDGRIKSIDDFVEPMEGIITYGKRRRRVVVAIDHECLF